MEWLGTLQFGYLLGGAVAVLSPLLVLAYLRQDRAKKKIVSSVLILRQLSSTPRRRKRFVPPWLFFFELLCLLLLALAATLPAIQDKRERVAIVVDNSLSMNAFDPSATSKTRIGAAIAATERWVAGRSPESRYTLFTTAPRPERIGDDQMSQDKLLSLVETIAATPSGDSIEVLIGELAQSGDYDRVFVVTDRPVEDVAAGNRTTSTQAPRPDSSVAVTKTFVDSTVVGSKVQNPFISNIRLASGGLEDGGRKILSTVALAGTEPMEVTVSLVNRTAQRAVRSVALTLTPERPVDIPFAFADEGNNSLFELSIAPRTASARSGTEKPNTQRSAKNALWEDDTAWISTSGGTGRRILVVTPGANASPLGLDAIEGFDARAVTPEQFESMNDVELSASSLVVYHLVAPRKLAERPSLFVLPPAEGSVFRVTGEYQDTRISSWLPEHSITAYLNVPLLNPGASVAFEVPLWAQPVISSERGPIVIAGESHGVRLAAVGFEILPFEGARTPATSILSLNMLSWLLSSTGGVEGLTLPGTIHRLDPAFDWKVRGSDGEVPVRLDEAKHPSVLLARPGVYQLDGSPHGSGQSRSESLIVNVLIPEESQVAVPAPIRVPDQVEHQKKAVDLARPLWPLIIWAVIGLLMLETASRLFRRKVA